MTDPRFTTDVVNLDGLLGIVDVSNIGDIETLLMFLLARPLVVKDVWDEDYDEPGIEVIIEGSDFALGWTFNFPLSLIELARGCASTADDAGPREGDASAAIDAAGVAALDDEHLVAALQDALGKVRLFNIMVDGEDGEIRE